MLRLAFETERIANAVPAQSRRVAALFRAVDGGRDVDAQAQIGLADRLQKIFGGDAIVEQVFNWQGVRQWAVAGMLRSDLPVVQGFVLLSGVITLVAYLLADLIIFRVDPRIRRPQGRAGTR